MKSWPGIRSGTIHDAMNPETLEATLIELLGGDAKKVSRARDVMEQHSIDKWYAHHLPDIVVFAESTADVQAVMKFANEHEIPVTTRGGGVGYVGGAVPWKGGIVLSVRRMDEILEINPTDGVAVVQPGVILGDLQKAVRDQGWFYPPDPSSLKECTVGGTVATNAGGPRCLKYGVTRHYVLGLEVVLADGRVLRTGGRCHKNKTGFDLIGMFVGSEGLLGVVTEITVRIIPHPPARATFSVGFREFREAATAVQRIFAEGYLPSALEIADKFTLEAARNYPGNDFIPDGDAHLLVDLDGQESSVKSEVESLRGLLESLQPLSIDVAFGQDQCEQLWEIRRSFSYSLRDTGLKKLNEDIVVPRSRLMDLVHFGQQLQEETGYAVASFGHAGDGNIHVNIMVEERVLVEEKDKVDAALDRLFHQVLDWKGVITGEHGIGLAKKRWFSAATSDVSREVHSGLKAMLDPKGILNPGKFV